MTTHTKPKPWKKHLADLQARRDDARIGEYMDLRTVRCNRCGLTTPRAESMGYTFFTDRWGPKHMDLCLPCAGTLFEACCVALEWGPSWRAEAFLELCTSENCGSPWKLRRSLPRLVEGRPS